MRAKTILRSALIALAAFVSFGVRSFAAEPAAKVDFGEPGPQWLRDSETYALWYAPEMLDVLAQSKVKFITHCPVNREFFDRCHALGIRCLPYVTFYHGDAAGEEAGINIPCGPKAIEVDAQGNYRRSAFWQNEDNKNKYLLCPSSPEGQNTMVAWVERMLDMGADGIFLDVVRAREVCYGPKFGKHKHLYDDPNHAFAMLLKRVRETIKRHKPDGALVANSGEPLNIPPEFWKYLDADMLESYLCTWVSKDRLPDWKGNWHAQGQKLRPLLDAGKQIQALSYLGHTPFGIKEDAFFCYASARLAGFVWHGQLSFARPETAALYRLSLGKPLGEEVEENGVYWRAFETGLVAVNPTKDKSGSITVKSPIPGTCFYDLAGGGAECWTSFDRGYRIDLSEKHGGSKSVCCENSTTADASGILQHVELKQDKPQPIVIGGWSKAQNVSGQPDGNYALYVDVRYVDETSLFGQVAPFACGTHDWQFVTTTIQPTKPIKTVTYHALFRGKSGKVWFDDVSLKTLGDPQAAREMLGNASFEEPSVRGCVVDTSKTGKLTVPAYSGRVFLYASPTTHELAKHGARLTIATNPGLGEVRFRIDGFDYWTHSGSWGTEYMLGDNFGRFSINFDKPGKHVIEVVDVVPADMKTPTGYNSTATLGPAMDPSNPTKPSGGRKFRFHGWTGVATSDQPRIEVEVSGNARLTAVFDSQR